MSAAASEQVETNPAGKSESHSTSVIVVDLGKQKRKAIKGLKAGTGKLMDEVLETLAELRNNGAIASKAQPIVILVRERLPKPKLWY